MISDTHFFHNSTRKLITAFGTVFSGLTIERSDGNIITVPIMYGSKEKWYYRLKQNSNLDKQQAITLPRLGFFITDWQYNAERKLNSSDKIVSKNDADNRYVKKTFQPVPYNLPFELYLWAKNMDDGLQIIEQILPFFKPSFNITITELVEPEIKRDVPITLNNISFDDNVEGGMDSTRMLQWTLSFEVEGNFYGPISDTGIITEVFVDVNMERVQPDGTITDATSSRMNLNPDPLTAQPDDPFGLDYVWEDNPEGEAVPEV